MSSSLFNIEKLDESDYDSWNIQVKSVLVHQELWSLVSDGVKPVDNAANVAALAAWKAKDEKAMATIILSITPMQIAHVKNSETSKDAWNTLKEVHRPMGPVQKVTLFKQILNMRMADGEYMQRYICNINNNNNKSSLFSTVGNSDLNVNVWCIDSGASSHMCCDRGMFDEFEQHSESIMLAGDNCMRAGGKGTVRFTVDGNDIG